jgi:hypothetical protein
MMKEKRDSMIMFTPFITVNIKIDILFISYGLYGISLHQNLKTKTCHLILSSFF